MKKLEVPEDDLYTLEKKSKGEVDDLIEALIDLRTSINSKEHQRSLDRLIKIEDALKHLKEARRLIRVALKSQNVRYLKEVAIDINTELDEGRYIIEQL